MNKLLIFLVGVYILICPFYVFESGVPQPAHYVLAIAFVVMMFSGGFKSIIKEKIVLYLLFFVAVTFVVNLVYYVTNYGNNRAYIFLLHIAYYIFNCLFFILFLGVIKQGSSEHNIDTIILFCLISLVIQLILAVLGINKMTQYIVTGRSVLYFNNPNQLAYFVLLVLSLFTIFPSKFRKNTFIVLLVILAAVALALIASSRIVLFGVIILALLLVYQLGIKFKLKYWAIISLVGLIVGSFIYKTDFIQKRITLIEIRNHRQDTTGVSELEIRGYDRIWLHPKNLVYGAGEGNYERFLSHQKGELHSGLGTVFFSYGIVGLLVFALFFYKLIAPNLFYNLLLLSPILLYNLAHQGFRTPLFWAVLAAVYLISREKFCKHSQ